MFRMRGFFVRLLWGVVVGEICDVLFSAWDEAVLFGETRGASVFEGKLTVRVAKRIVCGVHLSYFI